MSHNHHSPENCPYCGSDTADKIDMIYKAMYLGNGKPSMMIRIDRLERIAYILCFITGSAAVAAIGTVISKLV